VSTARPAAEICHVLREDVSLSEAIPAAFRDRAIKECIAPVLRIAPGQWSGERADLAPDGIGLLVMSGLLIRRVGISGNQGAELLGASDLLRPWQWDDASSVLPLTTVWRVLEPTRLAVLDRRVAARLARYPELTSRLVARALERSRNLAVNMAIVQQTRVQVRLHMLLWHLAQRWGYVSPAGTVLPVRVTQNVLAELVASRRPTVSTALNRLVRAKLIQAVPDGWLLLGEPPGELPAIRDITPGPD
jgi:CRP/FNR family transcriptional regulator, cyclic AMP receptor protein